MNYNIAILISGHIRDCLPKNITENIINPLTSEGYNVDIFVSTWELNERRIGGTLLVNERVINNDILLLNPIKVEIEENKRQYFLDNYKSVKLHEHMSTETCADATSQLYKLYKCSELMNKKYDIIIRLRPDIFFINKISLQDIKDCLTNNNIYMAEWHKKYQNVTMEIMDCFFFGNNKVMKMVCETYLHVQKYINDKLNMPDTSEVFIYKTIKNNNINISRTNIKYGVIRSESNGTKYIEDVTQ